MLHTIVEFLWGIEPIITIQQQIGLGWVWLARLISHISGGAGITLAVVVCFGLRRPGLAIELAALAMSITAVNLVLWLVIGLPRPDDPRIFTDSRPMVSSFPSGHTVTMVVLGGWVALRHRLSPLLPALLVLLIMLSRLYLGLHHLGDLVGGILLGLLLLGCALAARPAVGRLVARWAAGRRLPGWLAPHDPALGRDDTKR